MRMHTIDSCLKVNTKNKKIGPSQRETEVVMRFLFLDAQALNAKERHVILPLMIATFIMQFIAFITLPSQGRTTLNFPLQ